MSHRAGIVAGMDLLPVLAVTFRMRRDEYERLRELAGEHDRTVSAEIRNALRTYFRLNDQQKVREAARG